MSQYDQGYRMGAAATQAQARGARDAQQDRDRAERERLDHWNRVNQQLEQDRLRREQEAEAQRQRAQAEQERRRTQPTAAATVSAAKPGAWSGPKQFVSFVGLVTGGYLGYAAFGENLIAIGVSAVVLGLIAAALYKLVIGAAVVVGGLWIWAEQANAAVWPVDVTVAEVRSIDVSIPAADQAPR